MSEDVKEAVQEPEVNEPSAQLVEEKDKFKVLYLYADSPSEWNCSQWRCKHKSDAFNAHPSGKYEGKLLLLASAVDFRNDSVTDELMRHDVIIIERNATQQPVLDIIRYLGGLGKAVILDWDDAYQMLPWSNPAHAYWILNKNDLEPAPLDTLKKALGMSAAFTSPSRLILDDWSEFVRGQVFQINNYAPGNWYKDLPEPESNGRIVIGWGGSVSHYDSWWNSGLFEACTVIAEKYSDVLFRIHGNDPRIVSHLPVPKENKEQVQGVPPEEWPKKLSMFDIGLAPLHGVYDQRRSWLKGHEYSLAGVPWLGTVGSPYEDIFEAINKNPQMKGAGVAVGDTWDFKEKQVGTDWWAEALEEAIENLPARKEAARVVQRYAMKNWTSEANVEKTADVYRKIKLGSPVSPVLPGILYVDWPVSIESIMG